MTHKDTTLLPGHPARNAEPESSHEETQDKPKLGDVPPKHWPVLFQHVNVNKIQRKTQDLPQVQGDRGDATIQSNV